MTDPAANTFKQAADETPAPVPVPAPGPAAQAAPPPSKAAPLRLIREIGRGGMGIVHAAEQRALRREVAVKMVLRKGDAEAESAFTAEAIATARLDHPNVVAIHDLGRDAQGCLYMAMKLVRGVSWRSLMAGRRGAPGELRDHLEILLEVCDAVAYAHAREIIHRDLKPENVMVGEFGEVQVMDWGLALDVSDAARLARGDARAEGRGVGPAGTPCYMSPELAVGVMSRIGPATDVYLLGAILYEILTGTPPHRGSDIRTVLESATRGVVEPAARRAPDRPIPDALAAIAARALEAEPSARYPTVVELAQAVREFLRNEASMELAAAGMAEIARQELVIAEPGVAPAEVYGALAAALAELRQAEKLWSGNQVARMGIVRGHLVYAAAAIERGDFELAETELAKVPPDHARAQELAIAIAAGRAALAREARRRRRILGLLGALVVVAIALFVIEKRAATRNLARLFHEMGTSSLANSEARTSEMLLAQALGLDDRRDTREALLWAQTAGARLAWTSRGETGSPAITYSPDGATLAYAAADGTVGLLDAEHGRVLGTLGAPGGRPPSAIAFAPDGRLLATAGEDALVRVYDVALRREVRALPGHEGRVWGVAFSLDGQRLASSGEDRFVRLFDVASGATISARCLHGATVYGLAFRPGGTELASTRRDSAIRIWDGASGAPLREVRQPVGSMYRPIYTPDGKAILAGNDQTTITMNDADTGALLLTMRGHGRGVEHIALSPDGERLLTGSSDNTFRLWDAGSARQMLAMRARVCERQGVGVAWSPEGRYVAIGGADKHVMVWDLEGEREALTLRGHVRAVSGVRFSPDGKRVASSAWDRTIRIWDAASGRALRTIAAHDGQVEELSWGRLGRRIASGGWDRTVRVFDAGTGERLRVFAGHEAGVSAVDLSPDERLVASASEDGSVRLWDIEAGAPGHVLKGHVGGVLCVAVSPDGKRVASGGADRTVRIWDIASGTETAQLTGHEADIEGVAWSPDGTRLASGSWDGTAGIWDVATGSRIGTLTGHEGWVYGVSWSPDGRRLASASEDMTGRVWDVESGLSLMKLVGHTAEVQTCAWSPDGQVVATASYDSTVRLWSLEKIQRFLDMSPDALAAEAERHTGLRLGSLDPLALPVERAGGGAKAR